VLGQGPGSGSFLVGAALAMQPKDTHESTCGRLTWRQILTTVYGGADRSIDITTGPTFGSATATTTSATATTRQGASSSAAASTSAAASASAAPTALVVEAVEEEEMEEERTQAAAERTEPGAAPEPPADEQVKPSAEAQPVRAPPVLTGPQKW
jgi:hypothetical protein